MAEYNIQMGQRNNENTEWDSHYPITKAENVKTENSTVAVELANKAAINYVNSQDALKADKTYVDAQIQAIASGSPKGVYATLSALQTAHPTGSNNIYLVLADGNWYYWSGSAWTAGGTYQGTEIADGAVAARNLSENVINSATHNLFDFNKYVVKRAVASVGGTANADESYSAASGNNVSGSYVSFRFDEPDLINYFLDKCPIVTFDLVFDTAGDLQNVYNILTFTVRNPATFADLNGVFNTKKIGNTFKVMAYTRTLSPENYQFVVQFIGSVTVPESFTVSIKNIRVGVLDGDISRLWEELNYKDNLLETGKNKFDKTKVRAGFSVSSANGALQTNADYSASDFIPVEAGTEYTLNDMGQFAYFNENKRYISGYAKPTAAGPYTFTTPEGCFYIRATVANSRLNSAQLEVGDTATDYVSYRDQVPKDNLPADVVYQNQIANMAAPIKLTVKPDGTGDFSEFSDAVLSITDSSISKPYLIEVYEGTYGIMDEIYGSLPNIQGLIIPNYVGVKGIGAKENIIIKGELPNGSPMADVENISTINLKGTNSLENITVTAKNLRYAVHDESSNTFKDWHQNVKNCTFIHYGNQDGYWDSPAPWGEGCSSGSRSEFHDCEFFAYADSPGYLVHNNVSFEKPSYHLFDNCTFDAPLAGFDIVLQSYGSNQKDLVIFRGCKASSAIKIGVTGGYVGDNDFIVQGYGNSTVPQIIDPILGNAEDTYIEFADETMRGKNTSESIIANGTPCKSNGTGSITPMVNDDPVTLFVGVAQHNISAGAMGVLKNRGYISLSGLAANVGDKIGVVNGVLAVVESGDYIGVVNIGGYILLK